MNETNTDTKDTDHSGRKPICDCDDPETDVLAEGTPVEMTVCVDCSGLVRSLQANTDHERGSR